MVEHSRSLSAVLGSSTEDLKQQQEAIAAQMEEAKEQAVTSHQEYERLTQKCSAVRVALNQCSQELASLESQESALSQQDVVP